MAKRITKKFLGAINESNQRKTKPYDTAATVLRVEGDTAYVHIPGGVDETPVQLTIDAKPGDTVRVRVSNNQAWLTGNGTAPPTDDTTAKRVEAKATVIERVVNAVKTVAENAYRIAGNTDQFFWVTESGTDTGAHITEIPREDFLADPDNGGGNFLARTNGIAIRDGMAELATFSSSGLNVTTYDDQGNGVDIAHLGYGLGSSGPSTTAVKPYYTLGERRANSTIGNYSVAEGLDVVASGKTSHASGNSAEATGFASHAFGNHVSATVEGQTVIGRYNASSTYPFVVGNGSQAMGNSNALTVDWDGYVWHKHDGVYDIKNVIINPSATVVNAKMRIYGNIAQVFLEVKNTTSTASGGNVFTGTIYDQYDIAKLPALYVSGVGYYGAHAIVGRITTSGDIVLRNASPSAVTISDNVNISFTYIFA